MYNKVSLKRVRVYWGTLPQKPILQTMQSMSIEISGDRKSDILAYDKELK